MTTLHPTPIEHLILPIPSKDEIECLQPVLGLVERFDYYQGWNDAVAKCLDIELNSNTHQEGYINGWNDALDHCIAKLKIATPDYQTNLSMYKLIAVVEGLRNNE